MEEVKEADAAEFTQCFCQMVTLQSFSLSNPKKLIAKQDKDNLRKKLLCHSMAKLLRTQIKTLEV